MLKRLFGRSESLSNNTSYTREYFAFSLIFLSILGVGILSTKVFSILLIVFAGLLMGTLFVAVAKKIQGWTSISYGISVAISIVIHLLIVGGLLYLIGVTLKPEIKELANKVPVLMEKVQDFKKDNSLGQWIDENTDIMSSSVSNGDTSKYFQKFFSSTFGLFGDLYAILFVAIFIAVSPKEYLQGAVLLIPHDYRQQGRDILYQVYSNLKIWLKSQLLEMLIMFVLTAIALASLGLDYWLVLSILTALFCFIPNIGPMIALIPMVGVGLLDSPQMAFYVFAVFMVIQLFETGFIGPYIRKQMLSLPPALVLVFQLILGAVGGVMGILVATPIIVMIIVLVKKMYLRKDFVKE